MTRDRFGPAGLPSVRSGDATADEVASLVAWLREQVRYRIGQSALADENVTDTRALVKQCLDEFAQDRLRRGQEPPQRRVEEAAARQVLDELVGLGGLQRLLDREDVENILCNGADRVFVRLADGTRERVGAVARSDEELVELVRTIAARAGAEERRLDRGSPSVSVELPDGSRLFATLGVSRRPSVSIRRHRQPRGSLAELERNGTIDRLLRSFLTAAVRARRNIIVTGGTDAGKTTLLRALCAAIPARERLITIEDSYELGLDRDPEAHPDVVALQARGANIEGAGEIPLAELVRWALRMAPDRVIVGEVRGAEVLPMLLAMNQGNDGSLTTVHASSTRGAFVRLAAYAAQSEERLPVEVTNLWIAEGVHLVVHLGRDSGGRRVVAAVREVTGADGQLVVSNEIFRPGPTGRAVPGAPPRAETVEALAAAGFDPDSLIQDPGWGA